MAVGLQAMKVRYGATGITQLTCPEDPRCRNKLPRTRKDQEKFITSRGRE